MQFLNDYLTVDRLRLSSVVDEDLDNENSRSEDSEEVLAHATSLRQNNDHEEAESVNDSGHPVDQSGSTSARSPSGTQKKKMKRNINPENASSTLMKYILENKESERPVNSIDQFFSLMATTVKKNSPLDQHAVKTRVFTLISKIEEKYLTGPSSTFLPPAPIHHSQISPAPSSHSSSSSSTFLDISQSGPHGSSRDCPTPSPQHTYMQRQPASSQSFNFTDRHIISQIPSTSYYGGSSGSQRTTVSPVLTENNSQLQYSSTLERQGNEELY